MSKDLHHDLREVTIIAETDEASWNALPEKYKEVFKMKRVEMPNFKPIYENDPEWKERRKPFIDSLKRVKEREDEIRANYDNP